ncbi:MAG: hypothetical protein R6U89_02485 [Dehalococcoidia bacterium]
MKKKVVIQKIDLDTCLTAFILDVSEEDDVVSVQSQATDEDLRNPEVICIECGGSGQVHLNNFDHHESGVSEPACLQVFKLIDGSSELERVVEYVAKVDTDPKSIEQPDRPDFISLSSLFSGMLLEQKDPGRQLFEGMGIYETILAEGIDPFGAMPRLSEWEDYFQAKQANRLLLSRESARVEVFETAGGLKCGYLESEVIGGPGLIYNKGCDVAIVYSTEFGEAKIPKFTIAGKNGIRVDGLLASLNELEPGWGGPGHGTIIASPKTGSWLPAKEVCRIVSRNL